MKFAYTDDNGCVCIVHAAPKKNIERVYDCEMSDDEYERHIRERSIPASATDIIKLPADWQPPSDRDLRDKWRIANGAVVISD